MLYERQHGFKPGYSCESQVFTVCQDVADYLDEGVGIDVIIIYFSKTFDLVPNDRLIMKLSASGVDARVAVWVREFFVGCIQKVGVGEQPSKEVKLISGVPQGSVLGPLIFVVYVNNIWRNIDWSTRIFADDCIIYRYITNKNDVEKLQKVLDTLGELAVENGMKINPGKSTAIRFTRARVKNPLSYSPGDQKIPEASSYKYLRIILLSYLDLVVRVNYLRQKAWKAFHFIMPLLQKRN